MRRRLLVSLLTVLAGLGGAAAQSGRDLSDAERTRAALIAAEQGAAERAAAALAAEQKLTEQRIAAAARLRATEVEAARLASEVDALAERHRAAERALTAHAAALHPLLPLIERLALYPAETLLAVPVPVPQALRGLAVLHGLTRQLGQEAAALRAEQDAVQAEARALAAAAARLGATQGTQSALAASLDREIESARSSRRSAEDAGADAARRAAVEAVRADSLRTAIAGMEAERARAELRARADGARAERQRENAALQDARRRQDSLSRPAGPGMDGGMIVPVAGVVTRSWGDRTEAGPASGVSYSPPPGARVVAPCTGRIAFAGPFRSYGVMLIEDCGRGYHFVMAGFDRLDLVAGTSVQAGEPVGTMPGWDPLVAGPRPALYIELRHQGQAVNPAPFLRVHG